MNILIDNQNLQPYQTTQVKPNGKTDTATKTASAEATVENTINLSAPTDRIEISAQGRSALAQQAVVSVDSAQINENETQTQNKFSQLAVKNETSGDSVVLASKDAEESSKTSEASESSTSTNLTSLTENQIQDLVSAGTISQGEANTELSKREMAKLAAEISE